MLGSDYFFGKEIDNFYDKRIKEHPEEIKKLIFERNLYSIFGKLIPNVTTVVGICLAFVEDAYITGAITAGISEAVRFSLDEKFLEKKLDYAYKDCLGAQKKLIKKLKNKRTLDKLAELINKSD